MSARTIHRTRTNGWQNSIASSGQITSTRTDDPSMSVVTAPIPTLVIRFGGKLGTPFIVARGAPPAPPPLDRLEQRPGSPGEERPASLLDTPLALSEESPQILSEPPTATQEALKSDFGPPEKAVQTEPEDISQRLLNQPQEAPLTEPETPAPNGAQIELSIDSLPNHTLREPISVIVDPLGETMFTASMRDLDITTTGNSVGEALLLLKEQIDSTFEELNRRQSHLTHDEKKRLQMLHTYIVADRGPAKSRWF